MIKNYFDIQLVSFIKIKIMIDYAIKYLFVNSLKIILIINPKLSNDIFFYRCKFLKSVLASNVNFYKTI